MGQIPTQCDKKKNCLSHLHEMTRLHFWDKLNYRKNTILIIIINGIWFLIRKKCLKKQQHIHSIWNENFQCNIFLMNKHRPRSVHYSPHSADFTKPPDRRFFMSADSHFLLRKSPTSYIVRSFGQFSSHMMQSQWSIKLLSIPMYSSPWMP